MSEAARAMTGPKIGCGGYLIGLAGGHLKSSRGCERPACQRDFASDFILGSAQQAAQDRRSEAQPVPVYREARRRSVFICFFGLFQ